ncbi:MAG: nucleotidyl transferase AbiEii/AbiGii toxin family protein [Candidatus Nanopelagicales bacterium]
MAIKDAARAAHGADRSVGVNELIRQAHFDRLLCRVFSDGSDSEWVLKGGTGMLARVPNTRSTKDIDLAINGYSLDQALSRLRSLAAVDLQDHFHFAYLKRTESIAGDQQPYAHGYHVTFQVYLGTKALSDLTVDLVAGPGEAAEVDVVEPANRLNVPRLVTFPYRLYPVANQIADKVCATLATYPGGQSSRERDLIDLVVIANTQTVNANELREAIRREARLRGLDQVTALDLPSGWGSVYATEARKVPACSQHTSFADAQALMADFVTQVLRSSDLSAQWNPESLTWSDAPSTSTT